MSISIKQVAENLWQQYAVDIDTGVSNKIVIDPMLGNALGKEGITLIAERFKSMIDAQVRISGGAGRPISICPAYLPDGPTKATSGSKASSKGAKIARPPNAFILYRQHHHSDVVNKNPSIHNNQISVILGKQWQKESAEVKAKFKLMAEDIKKKHLHANPDYQYQPRKPTEKKRRMTRGRVETMRAGETASIESTNFASATTTFDETPTGNAVFTLGENDIDEVALAAAVDERNQDLLTFTTPGHFPPVIFHEQTEDVLNDGNFYSNLLDLDAMYPIGEPQMEQPIINPTQPVVAPAPNNVGLINFSTLWDPTAP
ncbi:MAG: hypothetical protein Q9202_005666 [Teloschistes flavicans]